MLAKLELYLPRSHRDYVDMENEVVSTNHGVYPIINIDEDEYCDWMDDNCHWQRNLSIQIKADIEICNFALDSIIAVGLSGGLIFDTACITDIEEKFNDEFLNNHYELLEENNGELIHLLATGLDTLTLGVAA